MAFDYGNAAAGATTGASIGSFFGPVGTTAGGLLGGIGGWLFGGNKKSSETEIQKKQRELVDQLIASLNGNGPYSGLFQANEADFNKSFREPALANFKNRTAPAIQQAYVGGQYGQQRGGTGIEDSLARAGVDMDQMLNQSWAQYQQAAQDRQANAISGILNQGPGAPQAQSPSSQYFGSESLGNDINQILKSFNDRRYNQTDSLTDRFEPVRKGFEQDQQVYNPYTGVQQ